MTEHAARAPRDGVRTLAVSGEVDIAVVDELLAEARACLEAAEAGIELDFTELDFIDSSGLGVLVRVRNEATAAGKSLTLVNVPASMVRLLEITGLTQALPVRSSE